MVVLWLKQPPRGTCAERSLCLGSNSVLFSCSFWNLQGEIPNLCLPQGGATWKGIRKKETGNQTLSGFQGSRCSCQGRFLLERLDSEESKLWGVPRAAQPGRLRLVVWIGGGFSAPSKSAPVIAIWFMSFSSNYENTGCWLCPVMMEVSGCSILDKGCLSRPPSCYLKGARSWIQMG